jgi:tRNA pseudouridine38-40 synthase
MVGTVALAGAGRWTVAEVGRALEAKSRPACGPLAPPYGLTFIRVDYEPF